ncbi:uncharacterized protein [Narcine bancroftii]|uniref:uncharacterized protein isoform X1 n=1 Tax=Narcine bancroftii TaxID=1343680 RepID=UPI003831B4D5
MVPNTLSRPAILVMHNPTPGINYAALAFGQQADPDILAYQTALTNLQLENIQIAPRNRTLLCDTLMDKSHPVIPAEWKRWIFNSVHNLAHPNIRITVKMVANRYNSSTCILDIGSSKETFTLNRLKPAYSDFDQPITHPTPCCRGRPPKNSSPIASSGVRGTSNSGPRLGSTQQMVERNDWQSIVQAETFISIGSQQSGETGRSPPNQGPGI